MSNIETTGGIQSHTVEPRIPRVRDCRQNLRGAKVSWGGDGDTVDAPIATVVEIEDPAVRPDHEPVRIAEAICD
jgi:hypothetical protein